MVDITSAENFFSGERSQSRAQALKKATRALDLAARAGRRLEDALNEGFLSAGLTAAQGRALRAIAAEPGLTVGQLTRHLGISKQSLAPVLKSLTLLGLVTAAFTHADRRRRLLRLSPRGETVWEEAAGGALNLLIASSAGSGPGGLEVLTQKLAAIAEDQTAEDGSRETAP
jgi:DNA-binding MarR family transcriptional regulator